MFLGRLCLALARACGFRVEEHRPPPRDRCGRYVSEKCSRQTEPEVSRPLVATALRGGGPWPDDLQDWRDSASRGLGPPGTFNPAEQLGLPPSLLRHSPIPFDEGDGALEGPDYQLRLRRWVTKNMDHWLAIRKANLQMVFCALEKSERLGRSPQPVVFSRESRPVVTTPKPPDKWCDEALEYYGFRNAVSAGQAVGVAPARPLRL